MYQTLIVTRMPLHKAQAWRGLSLFEVDIGHFSVGSHYHRSSRLTRRLIWHFLDSWNHKYMKVHHYCLRGKLLQSYILFFGTQLRVLKLYKFHYLFNKWMPFHDAFARLDGHRYNSICEVFKTFLEKCV